MVERNRKSANLTEHGNPEQGAREVYYHHYYVRHRGFAELTNPDWWGGSPNFILKFGWVAAGHRLAHARYARVHDDPSP